MQAAHSCIHCLQYDNNSTPPMSNVLQDEIDDDLVQCELCCCRVLHIVCNGIVLHIVCCP